MKQSERIILIDADVVSHFLTGGYILILPKIFPYPIKVLTQVYAELERFPKRKTEVDNLLNLKLIEKMPFPEEDMNIKKEFLRLSRERGIGESACMAVARFRNNILASSNLRDIKTYCEANKIVYLTTMDFLCRALSSGKMSLAQCNDFIKRVKEVRGKLPVDKMEDFKCRQIDFNS
jgi:hypothetical protein